VVEDGQTWGADCIAEVTTLWMRLTSGCKTRACTSLSTHFATSGLSTSCHQLVATLNGSSLRCEEAFFTVSVRSSGCSWAGNKREGGKDSRIERGIFLLLAEGGKRAVSGKGWRFWRRFDLCDYMKLLGC